MRTLLDVVQNDKELKKSHGNKNTICYFYFQFNPMMFYHIKMVTNR